MIECDCSDDSGEPWEWGTITWHKARKTHTCFECGDTIEPGMRYEVSKGVWDGRFEVYKTCSACVRIRSSLCPNGWTYGSLVSAVWECKGVDYRFVPEPKSWDAIDAEDAKRVEEHRARREATRA